MSGTALSLSMSLENNALCHDSVHNAWGMLTFQTNPFLVSPVSLSVDFVVVIDVSASIFGDSKLTFLQRTLHYLLSRLSDNQYFSLVAFNHGVVVHVEQRACTLANKQLFSSIIQQLQLSGSTSCLGTALTVGTEILNRRTGHARSRISTLMLFTDDLSGRGFTGTELVPPPGCVFNTFGFGLDHDSRLLHGIALKTQGVYYYLDTSPAAADFESTVQSTVGECVTGLLSTRAHQIDVRLCAQDGARIVALATPFKISENQVAKDYNVKLALLFSGEAKTILFRLSLRAMKQPMNSHDLIHAEVNYINTITGRPEILMANVAVIRPAIRCVENIPLDLDRNINRYSAATTITEAIELSKKYEFMLAQHKLRNMVDQIKTSASGKTDYCEDLQSDLLECIKAMTDTNSFQNGIHYAHACSSMYFMERSTGLSNRLDRAHVRHYGYGYSNQIQAIPQNCGYGNPTTRQIQDTPVTDHPMDCC